MLMIREIAEYKGRVVVQKLAKLCGVSEDDVIQKYPWLVIDIESPINYDMKEEYMKPRLKWLNENMPNSFIVYGSLLALNSETDAIIYKLRWA